MDNTKLVLTVIFLCVVFALLAVGAIVAVELLLVPAQLKVALSIILGMLVCGLGILNIIKFVEKSLIKNKM